MPVLRSLEQIHRRVTRCARCPELRDYCAEVGRTKRKAFSDWDYWAKPVPGFGDGTASLVIVGLAPAAHGANRTGRMFTGDRSGDFLYAALYRARFANQRESTHRGDELELCGAYITAACRCAPPANKPTTEQKANCLPHLVDELTLLQPRVMLALGGIGWNAAIDALRAIHVEIPTPKPAFGHGAETNLQWANGVPLTLLGCYHVSQQNTFTGRLTEPMIDDVLNRARELTRR